MDTQGPNFEIHKHHFTEVVSFLGWIAVLVKVWLHGDKC